MRSQPDAWRWGLALLVCAAAGGGTATRAAAQAVPATEPVAATASASASAPARPAAAERLPERTPERVREIVDRLEADPAFARHRTEGSLRFKDRESSRPSADPLPSWWLGLLRWLSEAGRGVVWLLAAVAVACVAVFAWRWVQVRADRSAARSGLLPSHVNDLDIRPESLPDDIAAAARVLGQRGQARAALSLLYRGALSRLVHDHGAGIRAASTEGECVAIAAPLVAPEAGAYFARLVRAWQTAVYAGREPEPAEIAALCDAFDRHFAPRPLATAARPGVAGATA